MVDDITLNWETRHAISCLLGLAHGLNTAIDRHELCDVSVDNMQAWINSGTVFDELAVRSESLADRLHLFSEAQRRSSLLAELQCDATLDAENKFGVRNGGLHLLLSYVLDSVRQRIDSGYAWPQLLDS